MTTVPDLDGLPLRPSVRAALREAKAGLEHLYGERLICIVLFGSQARGEAHDESDVDVLVVLRGPLHVHDEIKRTNRLVSELLLKYQEFVTIQPFSEEQFADPGPPLLPNAREEGVVL